MTSELDIARNVLEAALGKYMDACLTTQTPDIASGARNHIGLNKSAPELLVNECLRLASLQKQIQQARASILISRNSSLSTVPINALPAEVLTRIFQLVDESEPCRLDLWNPIHGKLPKYPIPLTHVCVHWRQIILHTPIFWSHIDIIPLLQNDEGLQDRTQAFITRAAHSPLDLHITTLYPTDEYWEAGGLQEFLSSLVPRMRSLDIDVNVDESDEEFHAQPSARGFCTSVLSLCFGESCLRGVLKEVNLNMHLGCSFIGGSGNSVDDDCLQLDIPSRHLEDIWRHVTVLRLNGILPLWGSSAYYGLLELSLGDPSDWPVIVPENQLVNILSSSPLLRVLTLNIRFDPAHTLCKAVSLPDLKGLVLCLRTTSELECVMRLIDPGPKPLRITIHIPGDKFNTTTEAAKLFARSNLNALHFVGVDRHFKLLGLVNTIENLAFTISSSDDINTLIRDKPAHLCPDRLHILNTNAVDLDIDILLRLVEAYVPKRLLLWGLHRICRLGISIRSIPQIEEELSIAGTVAKVRLSEPPKTSEYSFTAS